VTRFGMTIDLNRCVGCQACTIACKHANATPPGVQWRRVIDVEQGSFPDVERVFMVVGCQHCAEPPCVPVCPTGATLQRDDGLVTMNYDLCIGCASCAVACPYQARTIVHELEGYYGEQTVQEQRTVHEDRIGVANKCSFCVERIDAAEETGLVPGVDAAATPACALSCNAQAIQFGDFADPESIVSRLARDNASFQMHAGLGTDPQIRYLYEVKGSTPGRARDAADMDDEVLSDPANPLVGHPQTFWDYRAAMNFIAGGAASGLAVVATFAWAIGGLETAALARVDALAAALMAVGLFFVFLKLGRKARFLYVLLRPQTSWMTRETWCVGLFYPSVALSLLIPGPVPLALAGLAAAGFLYCQGRIIHASKGIPAWRAPLVPGMLVVAGLTEGVGLLAIAGVAGLWSGGSWAGLALAGIGLAGVSAWLWHRYVATAKSEGIPPLARRKLEAATPYVHAVAHGAPALLFAASLAAGPPAAALAGLVAVAGSATWKYLVICRAGHSQGFELPMMPQRGSGRRAAPGRLTPPARTVEQFLA
jgi:phenylacetyl-CoA:acceptor oxidoreductase subunit 1